MKNIFGRITSSEIRNVIAVITVLGVFILLYLLCIKPIPVENKDILQIAVGFVFGGALGAVMGFFFGASKKDTPADKDETLIK